MLGTCCLAVIWATGIYLTGTLMAEVILDTPSVIGFGSLQCRTWPHSLTEDELMASGHAQWMLGIASGKNLFAPPKKASIFLFYDERNIVRYMGDYCSRNPDKLISEGAYLFLTRSK
jgi:hypothetical protein